ncbi:MAG: type II secretion system protein GspD [Phycisphaerae bacterium]|nr:type II secretion system protein GspD [Phycisphaerae bacterium]
MSSFTDPLRVALWLVGAALLAGPGMAQPAPTSQPAADDTEPPGQLKIDTTDAGLLDVHVRETPIATILEMLSYQARTNIVASTSVTSSTSANLYDVTLEEALDAILIPNQLSYRRIGNVIYVGTAAEMNANGPIPHPRVFQLQYLTRADAIPMVEALLSASGKIGTEAKDTQKTASSDVTGDFTDANSEYIVVIDTDERLAEIAALLKEVDVRPRQVLIEATILRATLTEGNQLGVDMTLLSGVDFQDVGSTSNASANLATGKTPPARFQETTFNVSTNMMEVEPTTGFTFGIIKNNVAAFVHALENVTDVTVLANPKVVALNRQTAEVIVGRRDGYITTTVTETAAVQSVEFLATGTQIRLCPLINTDGTVRLDVWPKDSNGGLTADNLPFEETTEAHNQIIVEDGHTVLIGGLFRERTVNSRTQMPLLGDIPIAGQLFQQRDDTTVREEVIILLTVRILKDTPAESAEFDEVLRDVERIRVGSRKGLMGTGRERLAQAFYQEAVAQAEAGNTEAALLNVRMALHNHPREIAALKLKERLLATRMWESDGTRGRALIFQLLDRDRGPGPADVPTDPYGRPRLHRDLLEGIDSQQGDTTP